MSDYDDVVNRRDETAPEPPMDDRDRIDENGALWVMCACGHRAGGGVKKGDKIALCPNCNFLAAYVGQAIPIPYPDLIPPNYGEKKGM